MIITEIPTGEVDGINKVFELSQIPNTSFLMFFVNGQLQTLNTDFTLNVKDITLLNAPASLSPLTVTYDYDVSSDSDEVIAGSSQFLLYRDVDNEIQGRMSNQAPSESRRVEEVMGVMDDLNSTYDLESTKRRKTVSIIANGSVIYNLAEIVTDADVKRIKTILFTPGTIDEQDDFAWKNQKEFDLHISQGIRLNEYTTFFENGNLKINVNTSNFSSVAVSLDLIYFSNRNVIDENNIFLDDISNVETDYLLVPKRFKPLIVAGALTRLWPMALGEDGEAKAARNFTFYKNQLVELGLDQTGHDIKQEQKKLRIRKPY